MDGLKLPEKDNLNGDYEGDHLQGRTDLYLPSNAGVFPSIFGGMSW